ncbi:MAG: thioredoxin domain-containing protein [Elusimicrobiota bacterium]
MPSSSGPGRYALGAAAVLFASGALVFSLRRTQKPYSPDAPSYRQKGAASAPIVIVEFSDFQCPACKVAEPPMRDLLKLYGGDIRFIFKHFPLEHAHAWARPAARASECAGRQGKFWELHDALYDNQAAWSNEKAPELINGYAKGLGLDMKAFEACLPEAEVDLSIAGDMQEGEVRWVSSTPTFFINGKRFVGARQLSTLGTIWIDKLKRRG